MSSMVTASTMTAVSSAITITEFAAAFTLVVVLLLSASLLAKELAAVGRGPWVQRFTRGLDLAMVPMIVALVTVVAIKMTESSS